MENSPDSSFLCLGLKQMSGFSSPFLYRGLAFTIIWLVFANPSQAKAEENRPGWIDPKGISGSLVICGGGALPESVPKTFLQLAGGEKAKLVVVPTAGELADQKTEEEVTKRWTELGAGTVKRLHTRDRKKANDPMFLVPLKEATGVWFEGGQQSRLAAAYQGTAFETELLNLLKRGGVIGGTSAGAAIQTRVMIASGRSKPNIQTGLDLLPGAIIDQHFSERNRLPRLKLAVKQHPECIGLGVDEGTALIVGSRYRRTSRADRGRTLRVLGQGKVTVVSGRFGIQTHERNPGPGRTHPGSDPTSTSRPRTADELSP